MAYSSSSDSFNKEYFLQNDVCRFCWSLGSYINIFTEDVKETVETQIINKIQYCLNIDLSKEPQENAEKYPNKVCYSCFNKIEDFCLFKDFCIDSDRKLKEIFLRNDDEDVKYKHSQENTEECNENFELPNSPFDDQNDTNTQLPSTENDIKNDIDIKPSRKLKKQKATSKTSAKTKYISKRSSSTYCNICCEDYNTIQTLNDHKSEAHGIESNGEFKCFGCDRKYKCRRSRMAHEVAYCKGLKNGYKCAICNCFLPLRRKYELHMRQHRNKTVGKETECLFKCRKCVKTFETKDSWRKHMNAHGKNYVCETCGRVFTRADYLLKHSRSHADDRRYACPTCEFRCTQKTTLNIHMRKHTGERPYSCDVCPQRCVSSSNLQAHRRRHLGINSFECQICSKKFGYKLSLVEHMESVHERSQSYICTQCGATYTRERGLKRHLRAKHSIDYKTYKNNQGVSISDKKEEVLHQGVPNENLKENNDSNKEFYFEISGEEKYILMPKSQYQVVVIEEMQD